jgi:protein-S-isoprenylcysteine O-methyltransferase Ste14
MLIIGRDLSLALLAIVLVFYIIDFQFMNRYDRKRDSRKGWSLDYTLFTIGMALAVTLQPWLFPSLGWALSSPFGAGVQILGCLFILLSFGLHLWARQHLRQFYVERVELQNNHKVIDTGPYAYIRHPIIVSFFGLAIGVFLFSPSIVTLAVLAYTFWDFFRAAKQEEHLLQSSLPEYNEYMRRTPRFIPIFWRRP